MHSEVVGDVLAAVASAEGVEPTEVDVTIERHVSTDAIRELASHGADGWELRFELADREVTVDGEGAIAVDGSVEGHWTTE